ncbi:hypothetical protein TRFO_36351 [Tritrichomonas foetus]|uniref:Uncharacterized protein n=1 Tax=Tritrichomonas foetus TaxID=1144522 RepID=A0A1J4JE18_9EUKA|nr:hypothetical protein TRFO_36351 [Tritrichomonas foetus]|eukprot:OHS97402.1 hypothetical protein TRFO_36351 [Tritrichomonas foetus]
MSDTECLPAKEQCIILNWFARTQYNLRIDITSNIMKKYYPKKNMFKTFISGVNQLSEYIYDKIKDSYIKNSVMCLENCLKFHTPLGYNALLINIFFLREKSISDFWYVAFCGRKIGDSQYCAINPDENIDAFVNTLVDASRDESIQDSREYVNYFISRFLKFGLESTIKDFNQSRTKKIIEPLSSYLVSVATCNCNTCEEAFKSCCKSYQIFAEHVLSFCDDQMNEILAQTVINLFDQLYNSEHLLPFIVNLFNKLPKKIFNNKLSNLLPMILIPAWNLIENEVIPPPGLFCCYLDVLSVILQDPNDLILNDPCLVSSCVKFIYVFRHYEQFNGLLETVLNSNLRNMIEYGLIDELIAESFEDEDEKLIKILTDMKIRKRRHAPLFDKQWIDDEIKKQFDDAINNNLKDIEAIKPIEDSCKATFQMLYEKQVPSPPEENQSFSQNQKQESNKPSMNIFLE